MLEQDGAFNHLTSRFLTTNVKALFILQTLSTEIVTSTSSSVAVSNLNIAVLYYYFLLYTHTIFSYLPVLITNSVTSDTAKTFKTYLSYSDKQTR